MGSRASFDSMDSRPKFSASSTIWMAILSWGTALCMALCVSAVHAQSGAGSIQGTVTDATKAVIPGASIHIVNPATGVVADTKTISNGSYVAPGLFTGTYIITVTAPGMETDQQTLELLTGQTAAINFSLKAGSVTQKVEVTADAVQLVTTTDATLSSTLEAQRINQLPMNGRIITSLVAETTPGLTTHLGPGSIVNGLMEDGGIEYEADGVPLINRNFGGPNSMTQAQYPDPDTVQEVRTETSNSGAQFATPGTAIISTKSGTNSLHGTAFETMRNNAVGIAKGRTNPSNYAAPHLVRNEFGASAGGPIMIPHVYDGRNKSFWFFAYERYSQISTVDENVSVPTVAMRNGDFSGLISNGNLQQLYDPATTYNSGSATCPGTPITSAAPNGQNQFCRLPFVNNQIPISRLDPTTKILYDITPLPSNTQDPLSGSDLTGYPDPTVTIVPTITFRVDHTFTPKDKVYVRYTSNSQLNTALRNYPSNSPATLAADGIPAGASGYQSIDTNQFAAALGYTHIFSPTFYSEFVGSQQWFFQYVGGGGADANANTNYEANNFGLPNNFGETGFPVICSSCLMPFGGTQYQYYENQIIFNYDENLTKIVGKHQFHFGGRYRRERLSYLPSRQNDSATFDATGTSLENPQTNTTAAYSGLPNTGETEADFFLGNASLYSVTLEPPQGHGHDMEFDGYFQDDWRVTKNLTLNLGLRNTYLPGFWTKDGLATTFDFKNDAFVMTNPTSFYIAKGYTTQAIVTNLENNGVKFETSAQAGFPSTNMDNKDEFEPRVGLAWQPFGSREGFVLRGGYGRYVFPTATRSAWQNSFSGFPYVQNYTQNYNSAAQSPDGLNNYLVRNKQSIFMGVNDQNVVNSATTNAILPGSSVIALSPNYPPDVAQETSVTIEQPLKGNSALRVSFVWTHGSSLDQTYAVNTAQSPFVWEMSTGTAPPAGGPSTIGTNQYVTTALNPYNNVTYGGLSYYGKTGYSNDDALQVNYQRLFHHGIAYQIWYVYQKAYNGDGTVTNPQDYAGVAGTAANTTFAIPAGGSPVTLGGTPPPRPANVPAWQTWRGLTDWEGYEINAGNPKQYINFNGLIDLPFGTGKRFLGHANRFLNEIVGGFQLAGDGNVTGEYFNPIATQWGPNNPIKLYKHGLPIQDCRTGVCLKSYEWFNGYLAPKVLPPANGGVCTVNCVNGLPTNWVPFTTPINNTPFMSNGTTPYPYYGTNDVLITSPTLNGAVEAYSPGPSGNNRWSKTIIPGPTNWTADLSLFKVFPITEKSFVRINVDAFNLFNVQGYNSPSTTDGTEPVQPGGVGATSHNTPRQLQLTARITF
jgi:hypothetical protein